MAHREFKDPKRDVRGPTSIIVWPTPTCRASCATYNTSVGAVWPR